MKLLKPATFIVIAMIILLLAGCAEEPTVVALENDQAEHHGSCEDKGRTQNPLEKDPFYQDTDLALRLDAML